MRMLRLLMVGSVVASGVTASAVLSSPAMAMPTCVGHRATIIGTDGQDFIEGTRGNDVIVALAGGDSIYGKGGNDLVCAGRGADTLYGGPGRDRLFGGPDALRWVDAGKYRERQGDRLSGGPGDDKLVPGLDRRVAEDRRPDELHYEYAPRGVRVDLSRGTATGQGHDSITRTPAKVWGSDYGDVIIGTDQADQIVAGRGADVVRGRGGNDEITVDPGPRAGASDTVFAGAGHDHVETGGGQDLLYGGSGSDIVETTGPGPDRIFTGDGRDIIEYRLQSQGRQSLSAGREPAERTPGARTLGDELHLYGSDVNPDQLPASGSFNMSTGELTYRVDGHQVVRMPAQGVEDLSLYDFGPEATWKIRGTAHDNDVDPGGNGTRFEGLAGDDEFTGTGGDDWYDGGPGNDVGVRMGDGNDTCISVEDFISSNPCSAPTQTDPNALLLATLVAWSRRTPLSSK